MCLEVPSVPRGHGSHAAENKVSAVQAGIPVNDLVAHRNCLALLACANVSPREANRRFRQLFPFQRVESVAMEDIQVILSRAPGGGGSPPGFAEPRTAPCGVAKVKRL